MIMRWGTVREYDLEHLSLGFLENRRFKELFTALMFVYMHMYFQSALINLVNLEWKHFIGAKYIGELPLCLD